MSRALRWISELDRAWEKIGIISHHPKKTRDAVVLGEVQGGEAREDAPFLGLGAGKVMLFMAAMVDVVCSSCFSRAGS